MVFANCHTFFHGRMSFSLEPHVLEALGVVLCSQPVKIPVYTQRRMVPCHVNGRYLYRAQPLSLSDQFLASIVLQIRDVNKFSRYYVKKKT